MISVLFVCLANICRSPAFEATLRHLAVQKGVTDGLRVDSCGMGWYHLGEHPDPRTFAAAKARGVLIDHRAQEFQDHYFKEFDYIFAVDPDIVRDLKTRAPSEREKNKVRLVTEFSSRFKNQAVFDPYYMGQNDFAELMEMIFDCCEGILLHLVEKRER